DPAARRRATPLERPVLVQPVAQRRRRDEGDDSGQQVGDAEQDEGRVAAEVRRGIAAADEAEAHELMESFHARRCTSERGTPAIASATRWMPSADACGTVIAGDRLERENGGILPLVGRP